ncbi:MAG: type II toxin-antitoxin system HicA family toxin [Clostridium sp.]
MVFKSQKVEKALKRKGFKEEPRDHKYFVFYNNGKKTRIKTKVSHCGQEINDYLIDQMKKQLHLNKSQFEDLINCPLSEEDYKAILKAQNII